MPVMIGLLLLIFAQEPLDLAEKEREAYLALPRYFEHRMQECMVDIGDEFICKTVIMADPAFKEWFRQWKIELLAPPRKYTL